LLIALAGYAVMYLPVYWWAAGTIWQSDEHAHGAIVLAVVVWLFWTLRNEIAEAPTQPSATPQGKACSNGPRSRTSRAST